MREKNKKLEYFNMKRFPFLFRNDKFVFKNFTDIRNETEFVKGKTFIRKSCSFVDPSPQKIVYY